MKSAIIKIIALAIVASTAGILSLALLFWWFWNISLPPVFHISCLTYLQSLGLLGLVFVVGLVVRGAKFEMNQTTTDT